MDIRRSLSLGLGIVLGIGLLFLAVAGTALAQGMMPPTGVPMPGMPGGMMGSGPGYPGGPGMMAGQGYTDTLPFGPGFGYGMMGPGMMGMGPGMMGFGMMAGQGYAGIPPFGPGFGYGMMGPGMMGMGMMGPGMMAGQGYTDTLPFGPGSGYGMMGPGMMGMGPGMMGMGPGMMGMGPGMMGFGMMGMGPGMMGFGMMGMGAGMMGMMGMAEPELLGLPVLSIAEAREAVAGYLEGLAAFGLPADGFTIGEVMVFDNHAYVQVLEKETGRGAFELLVEPRTRWVMPEPGPNMMWNLKYSPMARMMGWSFGLENLPGEMPIGEEDARRIAQAYAAQVLNGAQVAEELTAFYGYYTVDVLRDGEPVGMLSVNGYTGQVFVHHWHGDFVAMGEEE